MRRIMISIAGCGIVAVAVFAQEAAHPAHPAPPAAPAQSTPPAPSASTPATTPAPSTDSNEFVRFVDDGDGAGKLQTAVVTYIDGEGREVDLIGAVHIGEREYYQRLNEVFEGYDALLYEMVKPKDAVVKPGEKHDSLLSQFQRSLQWMLGLEFQLDGIDYQAANFVHADLTPAEFLKSMDEKGETFLSIFWNMFTAEMKRSASADPKSASDGTAMLLAFLSKDRARHLKYIFGKQMSHIEEMAAGLADGPKGGSTLVIERNKRALAVMKEQLDAGKKKVAIFYGAAHLPDMEERLVKEHGFKRTETKWLTAWDIPKNAKP